MPFRANSRGCSRPLSSLPPFIIFSFTFIRQRCPRALFKIHHTDAHLSLSLFYFFQLFQGEKNGAKRKKRRRCGDALSVGNKSPFPRMSRRSINNSSTLCFSLLASKLFSYFYKSLLCTICDLDILIIQNFT